MSDRIVVNRIYSCLCPFPIQIGERVEIRKGKTTQAGTVTSTETPFQGKLYEVVRRLPPEKKPPKRRVWTKPEPTPQPREEFHPGDYARIAIEHTYNPVSMPKLWNPEQSIPESFGSADIQAILPELRKAGFTGREPKLSLRGKVIHFYDHPATLPLNKTLLEELGFQAIGATLCENLDPYISRHPIPLKELVQGYTQEPGATENPEKSAEIRTYRAFCYCPCGFFHRKWGLAPQWQPLEKLLEEQAEDHRQRTAAWQRNQSQKATA